MPTKSLLLAVVLALTAEATWGANLYMSAGKTVYEFDSSGALTNQANVDTNPWTAQGLAVGPDNRLYVDVSNGNDRVDSFSLDLGNHVSGFVGNQQGGLFTPLGNAFGPDGSLYVAALNQGSVDRFFGPNSISPAPGSNDPSAGHTGAVWSSLGGPVGLSFAPDGTLYGSRQSGTGTLVRFDGTTGVATTVATDLVSIAVGNVAINSAGTSLYVRDASHVLEYIINLDHSLTKVPSFDVHNYATGLDSSNGLAVGPDGFLYATNRALNGNPDGDADYVVRIDPVTGNGATFVHGNINSFTSAQNPNFLTFAPVPEPSALMLCAMGAAAAIAAGLRRRVANNHQRRALRF